MGEKPKPATLCVDASLVVPFISAATPDSIVRLWQSWRTDRVILVAPYLLRYEVVNAIRRTMASGLADEQTANLGMRALLGLPIEFRDTPSTHRGALQLASRFNLSATYDAHYLALADNLGCELWTADKRLARAVQRELDWVRLLED